MTMHKALRLRDMGGRGLANIEDSVDGVADHVSNTKPSSFRVDKFCQ